MALLAQEKHPQYLLLQDSCLGRFILRNKVILKVFAEIFNAHILVKS